MVKSRSRSPRRAESCLLEVQPCEDLIDGIVDSDVGSTLDFDALSVTVSDENWVEKAVDIFKQYRLLVMHDLFSTDVTDTILRTLQELHANWSGKYDPEKTGNRMPGRYEMMDAYDCWHLTHLPGYLEALEEFAIKGGLEFLHGIGGCSFVGGHAHTCLAGTHNWQPLHSDFTHPNMRETFPLWECPEHVPFMDLLFTLHPLTSDNAPLRIIPGQPVTEKTYCQFPSKGEAFPPPSLAKEPDLWKRAQLFPLPAGCGVLRDLRLWHGGTPNTSSAHRFTAVLRFYSNYSAGLCQECPYEKPGIDMEDVRKKLSLDTQKIVSKHLIRSDADPKPEVTPWVCWTSLKDHWNGNNHVKNDVQTWEEASWGEADASDKQDDRTSGREKWYDKARYNEAVWKETVCDQS